MGSTSREVCSSEAPAVANPLRCHRTPQRDPSQHPFVAASHLYLMSSTPPSVHTFSMFTTPTLSTPTSHHGDPQRDPAQHPFVAAMYDSLLITIKGIAAGMQNTG